MLLLKIYSYDIGDWEEPLCPSNWEPHKLVVTSLSEHPRTRSTKNEILSPNAKQTSVSVSQVSFLFILSRHLMIDFDDNRHGEDSVPCSVYYFQC